MQFLYPNLQKSKTFAGINILIILILITKKAKSTLIIIWFKEIMFSSAENST